jgi:flagellar motor switch protein FliM
MTIADAIGGDTAISADTKAGGVLRRMLQARTDADQRRAPVLPAPVPTTPAKAAATAIGRAADRLYGLVVQPVHVVPGVMTLAELPELLPDLPLVVVLQGAGDHLGMIALCPQAVASLIEVQALGRVTARTLERRRPTRSDAMLCADFINLLLTELSAETAGLDGFQGIGGYRFLTHLDDPRPLVLMLEDKPLRSLSFDLRMGAPDARVGKVLLAVPQSHKAAAAKPQVDPTRAPASVKPAAPRASMCGAVQQASLDVVGVLCRRSVSLAELRALAPGRILQLPRACLTDAQLETGDGQILAAGKFGEAEGCHAIRLRDLATAPAAETPPTHSAPPPADLSKPDPFRPPTGQITALETVENATILRSTR